MLHPLGWGTYPLVSYPGYLVWMHLGHVVDYGLHGHGRCCVYWGFEQAIGEIARESHDAGG